MKHRTVFSAISWCNVNMEIRYGLLLCFFLFSVRKLMLTKYCGVTVGLPVNERFQVFWICRHFYVMSLKMKDRYHVFSKKECQTCHILLVVLHKSLKGTCLNSFINNEMQSSFVFEGNKCSIWSLEALIRRKIHINFFFQIFSSICIVFTSIAEIFR